MCMGMRVGEGGEDEVGGSAGSWVVSSLKLEGLDKLWMLDLCKINVRVYCIYWVIRGYRLLWIAGI